MSLRSVGTTGGSRARMEEQEPTEEHRFTRIRQASEETEGVYKNTDEREGVETLPGSRGSERREASAARTGGMERAETPSGVTETPSTWRTHCHPS